MQAPSTRGWEPRCLLGLSGEEDREVRERKGGAEAPSSLSLLLLPPSPFFPGIDGVHQPDTKPELLSEDDKGPYNKKIPFYTREIRDWFIGPPRFRYGFSPSSRSRSSPHPVTFLFLALFSPHRRFCDDEKRFVPSVESLSKRKSSMRSEQQLI